MSLNFSSNKKLKILCLHGYRQDANILKEKLGGFRKSLKNIVDLVFISSPLEIPQAGSDADYGNNLNLSVNDGRSWWFMTEDCRFESKTKSKLAVGFRESIAAVCNAFETLGPFDGILGFSQGASFVSLICGLKEHNEFPYSFSFVILVAGFPCLAESLQYLYDKPLCTSSLHIIGKGDAIIPEEYGNNLASKFVNPSVVYHDGGHFVPTQSEIRVHYKNFLENMLKRIHEDTSHSNVV